MSLGTLEAPIIRIPSDFSKNTPSNLAINLAVDALRSTVPKTIIKTNGVIYSAPGSPRKINLEPNSEAIPAATIPLGPTQLINNFSLKLRLDPMVLKNTPIGLTTKTTIAKSISVLGLYNNSSSGKFILAESKMKSIDIKSILRDSLK